MNAAYIIKHYMKIGRWKIRRAKVAFNWGSGELKNAPIVFANAMPKSGSHLIIQILRGLTQIGPFVDPGFPPANRSEDNSKLGEEAIISNLRMMRSGDIGYGYISAVDPFLSELTLPGNATVFVYRDPRDMIVSHIFYAVNMHTKHWMHKYYTEVLSTMEERINAAVRGVRERGSELTRVKKRYDGYYAWLERSEVLSVRFEDLILERDKSLARLLDFLGDYGFKPDISRSRCIDVLNKAVTPGKSGTFRKGKPGNWKEYFTEQNKTLFKEETGDLLVKWGYEKDNNW